jgi:hypothetical protein
VGLVSKVMPSEHGASAPGKWVALAALLVSVLALQPLVPCGLEARHLIPALPPLVVFAVAGLDRIALGLRAKGVESRLAGISALAMAGLLLSGGGCELPQKGFHGFARVAESLLDEAEGQQAVWLISSDATGEGAFIAEVAMRERRPGHVIRRSSKVLASSTWSGRHYRVKFEQEKRLLAFLADHPIRFLVIDRSIPADKRLRHHDLLSNTVKNNPQRFTLLRIFPMTRSGVEMRNALYVYRFR